MTWKAALLKLLFVAAAVAIVSVLVTREGQPSVIFGAVRDVVRSKETSQVEDEARSLGDDDTNSRMVFRHSMEQLDQLDEESVQHHDQLVNTRRVLQAPSGIATPEPTPGPPSVSPILSPSATPSAALSNVPSDPPSESPTATPSSSPSAAPSGSPTPGPSPIPSTSPTPGPTLGYTPDPTPDPTPGPTSDPTPAPSVQPTPFPTLAASKPSPSPTPGPTPGPTPYPTPTPSAQLTSGPTSGPTNHCKQGEKDEIFYKTDLSLKVDYRQKVPGNADPKNDAKTTCGFRRSGYDVKFQAGKGPNKGKVVALVNGNTIEVSSYMDRCQSWVRDAKKDDTALEKHEQLHFDICEYFARKMKADYTKLIRTNKLIGVGSDSQDEDGAFADLQKQIEAVYDTNLNELDKTHDDYDGDAKDSNGDIIPKEQSKWNKKVAQLLKNGKRRLVGGETLSL